MRIILLLILSLIAACRLKIVPSIDPFEIAKVAVDKFRLDRRAEACGSAPGCPDAMRLTEKILGRFVAGTFEPVSGIDYRTGRKVTVQSNSRFAKGVAKEIFTWRISGRTAVLDAYTIEIDFDRLAIDEWREFRHYLAAGALRHACAMTISGQCLEKLTKAVAVLGKADSPEDRFQGKILRISPHPFPESVRLETRTRFANGEALENFEWAVSPEAGFYLVRLEIVPAR